MKIFIAIPGDYIHGHYANHMMTFTDREKAEEFVNERNDRAGEEDEILVWEVWESEVDSYRVAV